MMKDVLYPIQNYLSERKPLIISMAAGLTIEKIESFCGTSLPVIRIMPNTPVCVGKGMIPYCCNRLVSQKAIENVINDLQFAGKMDQLDEHLIDAATALSGSGPAYMYLFLEALTEGAVSCGLPKEKALEYATITMAGAAEMVATSSSDPEALRKAVCSPGGSTIEGIKALENHDFCTAVKACVLAAYQKNIELGK
jgi:pyrroline-5-carboxylate reductase